MLNSANSAHKSQYKIYSNKFNTLIRIAKCGYYDKRFDFVKNNLRNCAYGRIFLIAIPNTESQLISLLDEQII
jgi:hypothetical protein